MSSDKDVLHPIGEILRYEIDDGRGYRQVLPDPDGELHMLGCAVRNCLGCWCPHSYERSIGAWFASLPKVHPEAIRARITGANGTIERSL
jgi:hypothetical protein